MTFMSAPLAFNNAEYECRMTTKPLRFAELVEHYRLKELAADNEWKTLSTRVTYEGYLRKWIVPRWRATSLSAIRAVEVELWLRTLPLARAGPDEVKATVTIRDEKLQVSEGHIGQADLRLTADSQTWLRFLRKEANLVCALLRRKIRIQGSPKLLLAFGRCFPS
jgi:putative sterol carrier protein